MYKNTATVKAKIRILQLGEVLLLLLLAHNMCSSDLHVRVI